MRFNKAILAVAIGSAAVAAWAAPGFGPDLFGMDEGEPRGSHHHRHHHGHHHDGHRHGAGPMSPERAEARIDRMAERLVRAVDGTPEQKQKSVAALKLLNYKVISAGDSFNDTAMLAEANVGFLFHSPDNIKKQFPQFRAFDAYDDLMRAIKAEV